MIAAQLRDPMIYILMAAVLISLVLREFGDAIIIAAVIAINAAIGVVQETKAERSLEALKELSSPVAAVRRDGRAMEVPALNSCRATSSSWRPAASYRRTSGCCAASTCGLRNPR